MSFIKNISVTFISKTIIIAIGLLTSVIVARVLGPSGKGVLAALGAIVGIALQFGNLGFQGANNYFVAKDKSKALFLVGNSFWISFVIGFLLFLSFAMFLLYHPSTLGGIDFRLAIIALLAIPFMLLIYLWQNILVGLNKIKYYNLILIFQQVLYLIGAIGILLVLKKGIFPLVIFNTFISVIIAFIFGCYLIKIRQFSLRFNWSLAKQLLNYGFKIYLACFFSYLVLRSDIFILNYFRGTTEAGLYSIAANFVDGIILLPSIIALLLLPKAIENLGQSGGLIAKTARISVIIIGIICLGVVILVRPAINFMFGSMFDRSFIPLLILIPGAFFWSLGNIISQYFAIHNHLIFVVYIWLTATILNIGLNIIFIPKYGMIAAAASSLLSYFLVFALIEIYFVRDSKVGFSNIIPRKKDLFFLVNLIKRWYFKHLFLSKRD